MPSPFTQMPLRIVGLAAVFVLLLIAGTFISAKFSMDNDSDQQEDAALIPQKVFDADSFDLANGLQVIVIPNHRAPVVTHMVWYKVGAADEPIGQSGIAHFLEHLMFKGSTGLAPGEFSETVRRLGGVDNAFTSQDYTAYFQSIAAEHLGTVMRMEASRMRGLQPPAEQVLSERDVVKEERSQRTDNKASARLTEQMRAMLHINHPYGVPVIGWMHEIENLNWNQAKVFYDRWYGPNNAVLIVTGAVTADEVRILAEQAYGSLPMISVPDRARTLSPPLPSSPALVYRDASVRQPEVDMLFRVPSTAQDKKASLALQVLEDILGGGPTSRLYQALVSEQKIASSVGMSYGSSAINHAQLWITAYPVPDTEPAALFAAIEAELQRIIADGISADELASAKRHLQDNAIYARDSLSGPAMIIGREITSGASLDYIENWPHLIGEVTADDVQAAAARYLNPDGSDDTFFVRGTLLPAAEAKPAISEDDL